MPAVQYHGIEQVLNAAERLKCPAWGLFINRNLFTKYEGTDEQESISLLSQILESLAVNETSAIHKIKFFESENGKPVKINEKTICTAGSFDFKLVDPETREGRYIGYAHNARQLELENAEQKKRIQELENELAEDEPETLGSVFLNLLKQPGELMQLVNVIRTITTPSGQPAAIGRIQPPPMPANDQGQVNHTEEDLNRLSAAIDTLHESDPALITHLEKMAKMAKENPQGFKTTIAMLDLPL